MHLDPNFKQLTTFPSVNCAPGGRGIERKQIPLLHFEADDWPDGDLRGLLLTSDLQCFDRDDVPDFERTLMSLVVATEVAAMCDAGLLPPREAIGVILGGDLYSIPSLKQRGGEGNVEHIWQRFGELFRWVAGVAGNHDLFDGKDEFCGFLRRQSNYGPLDGDVYAMDNLRVGGVSGIPGNPRKAWRYETNEFADKLELVLSDLPDILVLHQGPDGSDGQMGFSLINQMLSASDTQPPLIAFGHRHWKKPLSDLDDKTQLLSLDSRVVLITPRGEVTGWD